MKLRGYIWEVGRSSCPKSKPPNVLTDNADRWLDFTVPVTAQLRLYLQSYHLVGARI